MTAPLPVPFNDLKPKVAAHRAAIDRAIARVLDRGYFVLGPEVEAFEKELASAMGMKDAVSVGNGTDAIILALEARGIGPGDEVITSPMSAAFSALAISRLGATPVFGDIDPVTMNLDPQTIEARITSRTKAILPVHLYGHPADLDPIMDIAREHGLGVVEDACQAHGARYKGRPVGSVAGIGALSFYPTKNLGGVGDGGAILVDDPDVAQKLRKLRNGGQSERYQHEIIGTNSRLDEIQAAILRELLQTLDAETARRREIAERYFEAFRGIPLCLPEEQSYARAVYHLFVVRHPRRDAFMTALADRGVGTLIHYPVALHLQRAYATLGGKSGDRPNVEKAANEIVSLPVYPELTDAQVGVVIDAVKRAVDA
ncbi:MAG: DegT/DnrJ/EryC1/StrS family aminotransferase [Vicinamibacteria bacterium]|nr:DegT/DnrJ/EryC1/StrS family aminotransferase [Vicinamibacteria bacterium]